MKPPRILFVGNFLVRPFPQWRTGIDMRLSAAAIRNEWEMATFSERDVTRFLAPLGFLRNIGAKMMNKRLVKTVRNWKPDFIFMSHCDYVTNEALAAAIHFGTMPFASAAYFAAVSLSPRISARRA